MAICNSDKLHCVFIVMAAFTIIAINDGIMYVVGIYVSFWKSEMNVTRAQLDWIGSIQLGLAFCLSPVTGTLINKFGIQITTATGGLIVAVSFVVCGFTVHLAMLYIFYGFLGGCGIGLAYMSAIVAVTVNFTEKRSIAMGIITCGTGVGGSIMSILLPILIHHLEWRYSLFVLSGIALILCFLAPMLKQRKIMRQRRDTSLILDPPGLGIVGSTFYPVGVRMPSQFMGSVNMMDSTLSFANAKSKKRLDHCLGNMGSLAYVTDLDHLWSRRLGKETRRFHLLRCPEFDILLIACLFQSLTCMTPMIYFFDWLKSKGISDDVISIILSANGISGALARLLVGFIAFYNWCKKFPFIISWLLISGISMFLVTIMTEAWHFGIFSVVYGISNGAYIVLQPLIVAELVTPNDLTRALGIVLLSCGLGYLFGTPMMAIVYDLTGSYEWCYRLCGIGMLSAMVLIFAIWCVVLRRYREVDNENRLRSKLEQVLSEMARRSSSSSGD